MRHPMTARRVVYEIAGMESATVTEAEYATSVDGPRVVRVYQSLSASAGRAPAALLVFGYSDVGAVPAFGARLSEWDVYVSWAQLLAASGVTAITYTTGVDPAADTRAVARYVREHAETLQIDRDRVALLAQSGNVPNALGLLLDARQYGIRCAALLWGLLLDLDGHTEVAQAQAMFHFANPGAGKSVDDLPDDVPVYLVRAGKDAVPGLNTAMDRFVAAALRRNLPLRLVNHASGPHGFDIMEDSPVSKAIVRDVLEFVKRELGA